MPFLPTLNQADLIENQPRAVVLTGQPVLLCRIDGAIRAVANRCTHAGSALEAGRVRRGIIGCPLHGARFDLSTGVCVGELYPALRVFQTRIVDDIVEVALCEDG